ATRTGGSGADLESSASLSRATFQAHHDLFWQELTMKTRSAAVANDPIVEEAVQDYLLGGGSALGAVLCGFFTAAGANAGVLLGPVGILVAGLGQGARAFDGRLRQPGLGTKRPRGFQQDEEIPDAARVAVPASVAAAVVAHAYDPSQKLNTLMKPGISRAERGGAEGRASLLRRIRSVGAQAMNEPMFVRPMLRGAGPSQGGLLTPSDFGAIPDIDREAAEASTGSERVLTAPWAEEPLPEGYLQNIGIGSAVIAIDVRGTCAALCYRRTVDGFPLEDLELEAPLGAIPVERGITRVAPGARLPAPAPIAIVVDASNAPTEVVAAPLAERLEGIDAAPLRLRRRASTQEIDVVRA